MLPKSRNGGVHVGAQNVSPRHRRNQVGGRASAPTLSFYGVNVPELVAVPAGVVTAIGPAVAPAGTLAVMRVDEFTLKVAATPLNVTAVAAVKLAPEIVTLVPGAPLVGVNPAIRGLTVKLTGLVAVPADVVTVMGPDVAPEGTVAVSCVDEFTT